MFERFTKDARAVVEQALREARELGSPTVEAEHLLLALARRGAPALAGAGLDHGSVKSALDDELGRSLAVVGITWNAPVPPEAPASSATAVRFGASAKRALERAMRAAVERGDRRLEADHVMLGVLRAELGTVPRALAFAGIDREALAASV